MASSINASTSGAGGVITTADNSGVLNLQSGGTTVAVVSPTGMSTTSISTNNTFGFKNRIINGGMTIDQRNAGASVTPATGAYTLDRWFYTATQASKFTVQQNAGSVTPPVGFINYLGMTVASAVTVGASDTFLMAQNIEGLNVADLGFGTANAKTVTLSFWVRSSLTGTFGGALANNTASRSYPFNYTISSANTWTQISVTVAGDTSGTWLTTNGVGLAVRFGLGSGTTFSGTAGAWASANIVQPTGSTSVVGTNGATFYITGVQLEVGSQATSFDFRSVGEELLLCQRYYINGLLFNGSAEGGSTTFLLNATFPVQMRVIPTMSLSGPLVVYDGSANYAQSSAAVGSVSGSTKGVMIFSIPNFTGLTPYRPGNMNPVSGTGTYAASAEL